jgi:phosphatidylethanolamine-binding protein (PEBP) family uncharacterized protein
MSIINSLSNILNKSEALKQPNIQIIDNYNLYTLIMYDPDAKYIHWLVVNKNNNNGDTLIEYTGPNPPKGYHHYQFILYKQNQRIKISQINLSQN